MSDIGLNPRATRHDVVVGGVATETGIKFGDVVVVDTAATGQGRAIKRTTTAGANGVRGVVVTQTDPTNGSAVGDNLEVCTRGTVEINIVANQALTKNDQLVTSTTAGAAKKLLSETTPDVIGRVNMDLASTASVVRVSCDLNIYQHA